MEVISQSLWEQVNYWNAEVSGKTGVAEAVRPEAVREVAVATGRRGIAAVDGREARTLGRDGDAIVAEDVPYHCGFLTGEIQ